MKNLLRLTLIAICLFALNSFAQKPTPSPDSWQAVEWAKPDKFRSLVKININGLALAGKKDGKELLAVADILDEEKTGVIVLLTIGKDDKAEFKMLQVAVPKDIEAVTSIPGHDTHFLAIDQSGAIYEIKYEGGESAEIRKLFKVPSSPSGANFEGLAVQNIGGQTIIAWGDRAEGRDKGTLFWTKLSITDGTTSKGPTYEYSIDENGIKSAEVISPQPKVPKRRHIADLKIDSCGGVFIVGASDPHDYASTPGSNEHFDSYFYCPGVMRLSADKTVAFLPFAANPALERFYDKKVEGFEFLPNRGGIAFATDNEASGATFLLHR